MKCILHLLRLNCIESCCCVFFFPYHSFSLSLHSSIEFLEFRKIETTFVRMQWYWWCGDFCVFFINSLRRISTRTHIQNAQKLQSNTNKLIRLPLALAPHNFLMLCRSLDAHDSIQCCVVCHKDDDARMYMCVCVIGIAKYARCRRVKETRAERTV